MNRKQKKRPVASIAVFLFSLVLFAAVMTVLSPCGPKEDGTFMSCHQAGTALRILSGAAVGISLFSMLMAAKENAKMRLAADLLIVVLCLAILIVPGNVIHLCMMPEMRCRALMKPGSAVLSVLLLAAVVMDLISLKSSLRKGM